MSRLHPLEAQVLRAIRRQALIAPGAVVVVAVSGGVDSLALLHILHALAPRLRCTLHVASLDHGLRGSAGADDAAFVAAQADALGLPCTMGKRDVPALMRQWSVGVESAARRARYEFLAETATAQGALIVAAAHHADDQAETVLMRLIRGTAMRGLAGMRLQTRLPYAGGRDIRLIRPLLDVRRAQLEAYVAALGLTPRHDATNDQPTTLRNAVRQTLLKPFPPMARHLAQLSRLAQIDEDFFAAEIARRVGDGFTQDGGQIVFERALLADLPPALQLRIIANAVRRAVPGVEVPFSRIMACRDAIVGAKVGKVVQIAAGWQLVLDYERATLRHAGDDQPPALTAPLLVGAEAIPVLVPGMIQPPGAPWRLYAQIIQAADLKAVNGAVLALPPNATIVLRLRRPGDRFAPLGLDGHTQKLKQWMIDRKIPQHVRDRLPLLEIDGQIAAIAWGNPWPIADLYRVGRSQFNQVILVHFWIETA